MVNWKKEGYKKDEEVFIAKHLGLSNEKKLMKGEVIYVGTKNMKVSVLEGEKEKILEFNGERNAKGACFGFYYTVYKTEAEYNQMVLDKEKSTELREYISKNLHLLSLRELEEVKTVVVANLANSGRI